MRVTPQVLYDIREVPAGKGSFVLEKRTGADENYLRYEDARCLSSLLLPMMYTGARTFVCAFHNQWRKSYPKMEVKAIAETTLQDIPVTEVTIHERDMIGLWYISLYLDSRNAWALRKLVLAPSEEIPEGRRKFSERTEVEIQCADSPEGYPLPTRYVKDKIAADGTRRHERVVEILEYSRYKPSADEMSLASFGLAESVKSSKSSRWLWLLGIAIAVSALGCGFFVWRAARKAKKLPAAIKG